MFDKNQIWVIFLFEFKVGHKAAETICNISNAPGPGTANGHSVQWWFKKFCKGDERLGDEEHSGWTTEVDKDQLRGSLRPVLLQRHKKLPKDSVSTILWSFSIWSKLERSKSSISGCLMRWLQNEKVIIFECRLFFLIYNNNESFLSQIVMCNKKWILYDSQWQPIQWLDRQEAPKPCLKPNL